MQPRQNEPSLSRRTVIGGTASLAVTSFAGCLDGALPLDDGSSPATITDATNRTVSLPETISDIVAVGPGAMNLVAYANAIDMVVGVESHDHSWGRNIPYNIANPELQDLPSIGPHRGGDPELIASAEPDLILATFLRREDATNLSDKTNTPVVVIRADSRSGDRFDDLFEDLAIVGELLDRDDRIEEIVDHFTSIKTELADRTGEIEPENRTTAYIAGRSDSGEAGFRSTQHPFGPFTFANAENVATTIDGHATISGEQLMVWNPETIFISGSNLQQVLDELSQAPYTDLDAVQNDEVYVLLPSRFYGDLFCSVLANAIFVGKTLYPDQFEDVTFNEYVSSIYQTAFNTDQDVYETITATEPGHEPVSIDQ